ncbi:hypothetical protein BDQ17DRAFT_1428454 [Cyathus striatus]|nr:hypothetical protein BDQ17DRAFT_1428454 [Cyathus striatus]
MVAEVDSAILNACPGDCATHVKLSLDVVYETANRIHVKITDTANKHYEVPESVLPRPSS